MVVYFIEVMVVLLLIILYFKLIVGVFCEIYLNECCVVFIFQNVVFLFKKGFFQVFVEKGVGVEVDFLDDVYVVVGVILVDDVFVVWKGLDVVFKV